MTPEELIEASKASKEYIIDCHQETADGEFAFLAVTQSDAGELSVFPAAYIGVVPPNPEYEIIGFIWEGSAEAGNEWIKKNKEYLDKLTFKQA